MSLEPPPPCARCSKPITFAPFTVAVVDGAYATFHSACAPKALVRIAELEPMEGASLAR